MRRSLVLLLCFAALPASGAERLDPANTYAVIAGVLSWKDTSLTTFSPRHRKDQELHDLLVGRGVPKEHLTLLLDAQATTAAILDALASMARRARPGATAIFYYAGHGMKARDGKAYFASWDVVSGDPARTGLSMDAVAARLGGSKSARVLLIADCCYSGALETAARALMKRGVAATSLTSAESSNSSTGNWTFTQTLIDGLSGDPLADRDRDGAVLLSEVAVEVADAMRCREHQRSGFVLGSPDLQLAAARRDQPLPAFPGHPRGEYLLAEQEGTWRPARVLGAHGQHAEVELYDYSDKVTLVVPESHLRALSTKTWPVGSHVEVTWGSRTWEATVLKIDAGFHWITYPGWSSAWDEWVMADRIVGLWGPKSEAPPPNTRAEVEWKGTWWAAEVKSRKGDLWCIHYPGWADSWDECVPKSRIRFK